MRKVIFILTVLSVFFLFVDTLAIAKDKEGKPSKVKVGKFYDGRDGFFLSIPTGNQSRCIWVWAGGSARVPDMEVTSAQTATQKHAIKFLDRGSAYDFKVYCVDDFGNLYEGSFPK